MINEALNKIVAGLLLGLIYAGIITHPDQLVGDVNATEFKYMCGAVQIENGNMNGRTIEECINDIKRGLLTASVIENRKNSSKWKGSTTEEVILAKEGRYWQYASVTRNGFKTKEASDKVKLCVKYVLLYGPICPENVMYQTQGKMKKTLYDSIPVKGDKDELFYYE